MGHEQLAASLSVYLIDATLGTLRAGLLAAVGNLFLAGLAIIALLALFRRRVIVVVEVLVLGVIVAVIIYNPAVVKGLADALAQIIGATGGIATTPPSGGTR